MSPRCPSSVPPVSPRCPTGVSPVSPCPAAPPHVTPGARGAEVTPRPPGRMMWQKKKGRGREGGSAASPNSPFRRRITAAAPIGAARRDPSARLLGGGRCGYPSAEVSFRRRGQLPHGPGPPSRLRSARTAEPGPARSAPPPPWPRSCPSASRSISRWAAA